MTSPLHDLGRSRLRTIATAAALGAAAFAATASPAFAEVESGRNLEVNTSIEFALAEGWPAGAQLRMEVFRGTTPIASATGQGPTMEVNHLGDDCWSGVSDGRSPDIQAGDKIVVTNLSSPGDVDYLYARQVDFTAAGTSLSGVLKGRETAGGFDLGAAADGSAEAVRVADAKTTAEISHDAVTGAFTATLPGSGGEVFIDHVVGTGGGSGTTVAEPGGDGAPACGPRETTSLVSNSHPVINVANAGQNMVVGGPRQAPTNVTVSFGGKTYDGVNSGAGWTATIPAADLAALGNNANHVVTASFSDGAPNQTLTVTKDTIAPAVPTVDPAPGTYASGQSVALSSAEPNANIRYTVDGSTPTAGSTKFGADIPVLSDRTIRAIQIDAAGNPSAVGTFAYLIRPVSNVVIVEKQAPAAGNAQAPVEVQQPAGAAPVQQQASLAISARGLRLVGKARKGGLRYSVRLSSATRHLLVRVVQVKGGRRSVVQERSVRVRGGQYAGRVSVARGLKAGRYRLEIAPAGSDRQLVRGQAVAFRVR